MNPRSWMGSPGIGRDHATRGAPGVSRRRFFGTTVGFALGAGLSPALRAQGGNPHVDAAPLPIPGGVSPFGVFIHHFPLPAPGTPLAAINEPSQITNFNGFVGANRIVGIGTSPGFGPLTFQADMGFMDGEYVAKDGKHYNATFGFI
jgi:hypothetical protein